MKLLGYFVFIIHALFINTTIAENKEVKNLGFCKPTQEASNDYEPENFLTSNNLLRTVGMKSLYCGEKILIYGKVVDQNCLPISDAKVYIWHANCNGKYSYKPLKNRIDKDLIDINRDNSFTGNGTATTNNQGEFIFITTQPGPVHELPSHINLRIEHYSMNRVQTRLMLKGNKAKNPQFLLDLKTITDSVQKNNIPVYSYEIVLSGFGTKEYLNE